MTDRPSYESGSGGDIRYRLVQGRPFEGWEIHHIIPREFGGTNEFNNLVPLPKEIHYLFTDWFRYFGIRP
ncbi:HNH endonuclease signature motif containing protein [Gordonia spumicola]|uniref:HNH endonuclease signature motif containing protein n=1 Tax=Gordonia spumicola TaxID=589161 RepID=UPI001E61FD4C|nr:HNH endonuclease signature motif containing protein [Gordonia spumicola]